MTISCHGRTWPEGSGGCVGRVGAVVAGSSFPEGGSGMRIDRQGDAARRRQAPVTLDDAKLAQVKGGLKADRVQGSDPSLPGGN
jgi:hypothetical protein